MVVHVIASACVRFIDVGEDVYARVLTMRADKTELLALVAATKVGNLLQFTTTSLWHSVKSSANREINMVNIYAPHHIAMYFGSGMESWWEVTGTHVTLPVTIIDRRRDQYNGKFILRVFRKGTLLGEMVTFSLCTNI